MLLLSKDEGGHFYFKGRLSVFFFASFSEGEAIRNSSPITSSLGFRVLMYTVRGTAILLSQLPVAACYNRPLLALHEPRAASVSSPSSATD